jgi:hypothetical protein
MKPADRDALLQVLQARFGQHTQRHEGIAWADVQARLAKHAGALQTLSKMEATGGEPDVIGQDGEQLLFCDCSAESPTGRRSLCYDDAALHARKEAKPAGSAVGTGSAMGIELLTEDQYRHLQTLGEFDLKTSSWVLTPPAMRQLGGALFCDRRYGQVFTYHNGVQSYYAARGFRALLRV